MDMICKATAAPPAGGPLDFVLSDETRDRMGDVIEAAGWQLDAFMRNPIALFGHRGDFPIGRWRDVRVEGKRLVGRLELAAKGTSQRIDEVLSLVEQGILRAVSVGFAPLESEPLHKDAPHKGLRFRKQELLETSLVSIPANPSALQIARSLHVSDETMGLVFGKPAVPNLPAVHRSPGAPAAASTSSRKPTPMNISQRIEATQTEYVLAKDTLANLLAAEQTDEQKISEQTAFVEERKIALDSLKRAEAALAGESQPIQVPATRPTAWGQPVDPPRAWPQPKKKVTAQEHFMRTLVGLVVARARASEHVSPTQIIAERYGSDNKPDPETIAYLKAYTRPEGMTALDAIMTQRAASAPADTTTSGWASQLVETTNAPFMELLLPASIYPGLSNRGLRMNFGRSGILSIPTRAATPTIAGSFVGQGLPIPVRQAAFSAQTLVPKKLAVISVFTREIAEHSTPSIEGLIRNAIQEDTSFAIDTVLLDATAATAIRPAGLRAGVSTTTVTAGGGFNALVGDIKALTGALITATAGNIRNPVWIINPIQQLSISLTQNAGGDFPFKAEVNNNTLQGFPIIVSSTVTAGMIILVDAADYVSVEGDTPRFDTSDQATVHMEDTTPLAIASGAQGSGVLATPTRSLWQTDSIGLRMIMDCNWLMRRAAVAWTSAVTW